MSTATDEKVELDVNLDESVPCMGQVVEDCNEVATWAVLATCGHEATICDRCKPLIEEHQQATLGRLGRLSCSFGGETHYIYDVTWRPL